LSLVVVVVVYTSALTKVVVVLVDLGQMLLVNLLAVALLLKQSYS
jgi:hypothetical protein